MMEDNIVDQKFPCLSREWKAKFDKLDEVRQELLCNNFEMKAPCIESVEPIAKALVDFQRRVVSKEKAVNILEEIEDKIFHCSLCRCFYVEPVTLNCGHTLCKTCILPRKIYVSNIIECKQCGSTNHGKDISVNVLLAHLIRKWLPQEYEGEVKMLAQVQREFKGDQRKIVETLSGVLSKTPYHVKALKWRSCAFFHMGLYKQALEDAKLACDLRPFLPSVFHQRGVVLFAMGNYEKAILSFSRALALEPKLRRGCQLELLSCLTQWLDFVNRSKEAFLTERFLKGFTTTKFSYKCYLKFKGLTGDFQDEQQLLNELKHKRNLKITSGTRSSLKRPFEDNEENSPFGARNSRSKCLKTSTERDSSCSDPNQTALTREKDDLECNICYSLLYQPVTTTCGHTFCRECLQRGLDYRPECPCCRRSLNCRVERNTKVNKVVKEIVEKSFPEEYAERERSFTEEKALWKGAGLDDDVSVPIFVCMLAFPSLSYPLHIFEPRYRLMIRRCVELGSRMFGMCANTDDPDKSFADYGTMLYIEKISTLPDGRSIIQTTAGRRFRVVSRSMIDGYNTAKIEWLEDELPKFSSEVQDLQVLTVDCYRVLELWFNGLTLLQRTCVTNAVGPLPPHHEGLSSIEGPCWLWWALAAVPLQDKAKLIILSMTSLAERLQSLRRFLELLIGVRFRN